LEWYRSKQRLSQKLLLEPDGKERIISDEELGKEVDLSIDELI
jgi:hypothetical protein